jgi:hypothetical protein
MIIIDHNLAFGRPATTRLYPVIYFDSSDSKNLTVEAISSGTPNRFTPMPSAATDSPLAQRELLNFVFIRPGQTQFTRI